MSQYLIVYSHPNPKSFNHAIKEQVETVLKQKGSAFDIRDLYALKFNSVLSGDDFVQFSRKKIPEDIEKEQDYIKNADTLIFIYPVWWFGMPANLKGYIDRVFSNGFAFKYGDKGPEGLLKGKKVIILNTTGGPESSYSSFGFDGAIRKTIDAGIFNFCGFTLLLHKFFYAVPFVSQEDRVKMLEDLKESLSKVI